MIPVDLDRGSPRIVEVSSWRTGLLEGSGPWSVDQGPR